MKKNIWLASRWNYRLMFILPCPLARLFKNRPNAPVEGDKFTNVLALVVALAACEPGTLPVVAAAAAASDELPALVPFPGCKKAVLALEAVPLLTGLSRVVVPSALEITQLL